MENTETKVKTQPPQQNVHRQKALAAVNKFPTKMTVEIYTDNRPAVIVNDFNVGNLLNPKALREFIKNAISQNGRNQKDD